MTDEIQPLDPVVWFLRIEKIATGELGCLENSLRHAGHILQLTPTSLRKWVGLSVDADTFEALLEAGDFDTAAKHLIAQPASLTTEAIQGTIQIKARIRCFVLNRDIVGFGGTVATAVLNAWTRCLLTLRAQFGDDLARLGDQLPVKDQFEQHRGRFKR